jgi:hypothetical protein
VKIQGDVVSDFYRQVTKFIVPVLVLKEFLLLKLGYRASCIAAAELVDGCVFSLDLARS